MGKSHRRGKSRTAVLQEMNRRLVAEHGTPTLGNFRSPVKEIFYILLSARTTETLFQRAHRQLFAKYPNVESLANATADEVFDCIDGAGLGRKRSQQIVQLAQRLHADFGLGPARKLRVMGDTEAYDYLTSLPGIGPKSALCIMMYSLDMDVFPVDINVQRIAERVGVIPRGLKHYQAQERLPKYVPGGCSKQLHIAMVVHGRQVCLPIHPKCDSCTIAHLCKSAQKELKNNGQNP